MNGISCPFCAFGIEKKLLDVDGVDGVEVFLDDGRIAVTFEPETSVTASDLEEAVEKAGFELAALKLTVQGSVAEEEGKARLVSSPTLTFRLVEISASTRERLRALMAERGSVVIAGVVAEWNESEPTLAVESVEARKR